MKAQCRYLIVLALLTLSLLAPSLPASSPIAASSIPGEAPPVFLAEWGTNGTAEREFSSPRGVAVDSAGNVYVADSDNHRIQKFDGFGTFLRMWGWGVRTGASALEICTSGCRAGIPGGGDGQLYSPRGVVLDASDNVYVASTSAYQIQKFSSNGAFLARWGGSGTGNNGLSFPYGLAVDADGRVYVSDSNNHRVKKYLPNGIFIRMWGWGVLDGSLFFQSCGFLDVCGAGIQGLGNGQFGWPIDIAFDPSGNIYVAELNNSRIQKLDNNFVFLTMWGSEGTADDEFEALTGIAVDALGRVYAVDSNDNRIKVFNGDGSPLLAWGTTGSGNGRFDSPFDLAIDRGGYIYVSDKGNHRIQKFGPAFDIFIGEPEPRSGY